MVKGVDRKGALQEGLVQLERLGGFQNPSPLKRSLVPLKAEAQTQGCTPK